MKGFHVLRHLSGKIIAAGTLALLATGIAVPMSTAFAASAPCDLQCVQQFGDQRIAQRQTALTTLSSKLAAHVSAGHVTSAQAAVITGIITADQNGLATLKTQLDSATTAKEARADVREVYTNYRIYAVVLPREYHRIWLDVLVNIDARLHALEPKVDWAAQHAPASEQQQLSQLAGDYKAQLAEAESQIDAAQGQIGALTVQNFNDARTTYTTAYTDYVSDIKTAHTDIKSAASDLHQMVRILKGSNTSSSTATPATPAATATSNA